MRLRTIDLRKMNLEEVRELLRQVLAILGQIRELWSRLVLFFSHVANRAKAHPSIPSSPCFKDTIHDRE